jgi:hypothetical protein
MRVENKKINSLKQKDNQYTLSVWLVNLLMFLPNLFWPIVVFGSAFVFDNPSSLALAYLLFIFINAYPLYLAALAIYVNINFFKMTKGRAVLPPAVLGAAYVVMLTTFF